ncbi:hypothetical protein [Lichenicola sp.]|uniref:hypothetical protein n=1 Tax=Lichenicola sp. TaxID=2804529 RepID=UPI003AFF6A72
MPVIGPLWRRAPAWRLCLVSAVAFTGLAAMFPPAIPHWQFLHQGARTTDPSAHYAALPARATGDTGMLRLPPMDAGRQGIVPAAGRLLPLPTGTWHELALAREPGPETVQITVLDRIDGNHLTGLIISTAPIPQSPSAGLVGEPPSCSNPDRIAGHIMQAQPGDSPLTHECWSLTLADMHRLANDKRASELTQAVVSQLGSMNIAMPVNMLVVATMSSDDNGWMLNRIFLPSERPGAAKRVQDWAVKFFPAIQKGFARTLTAADLPPSVTRDPA